MKDCSFKELKKSVLRIGIYEMCMDEELDIGGLVFSDDGINEFNHNTRKFYFALDKDGDYHSVSKNQYDKLLDILLDKPKDSAFDVHFSYYDKLRLIRWILRGI